MASSEGLQTGKNGVLRQGNPESSDIEGFLLAGNIENNVFDWQGLNDSAINGESMGHSDRSDRESNHLSGSHTKLKINYSKIQDVVGT